MTIQKQIKNIKENWMLIALVLVLLVAFSGLPTLFTGISSASKMGYALDMEQAYRGSMPSPSGFAPEIEERTITKTASIENEVQRGNFDEAQSRLEAILSSTKSITLNKNIGKIGTGAQAYLQATYQIKTETSKYDAVMTQLKGIGKVTSLNENALDITETKQNTQIELEAEKERLQRYHDLYDKAASVQEKLDLTDRLFDQERRIKYLEDSLKNVGQMVDYSTIYLTLTEERSSFANVVFVKFSELVQRLVGSVNVLLSLLVWVLPWAIVIAIARWAVIKSRK